MQVKFTRIMRLIKAQTMFNDLQGQLLTIITTLKTLSVIYQKIVLGSKLGKLPKT